MGSFGTNILSTLTSISNAFRGFPRSVQITIAVALLVFTPVVSIVLGFVFGILGFILGFVQWKIVGVLILVIAGYKIHQFFDADAEDETDNDRNPFL